MPKSRVRKKKVYTPPAELRPRSTQAVKQPSPVWVPALAVTLAVVGILWLVLFYLTNGFADLPEMFGTFLFELRYWNLAIGFGFLVASLLVFSRWR